MRLERKARLRLWGEEPPVVDAHVPEDSVAGDDLSADEDRAIDVAEGCDLRGDRVENSGH